ncbi:hypothetical protein AKL17_0326 [Frigidibacter mobilis]|uniref:Anti-sigma factor n=1 Tax=Frigidibacter mobilis TaxID=1335048 RepID=A0A159Z0W8_9RHOB|nr:hypothetical protein AKL17_0326 [Frigidibacter mobilis]
MTEKAPLGDIALMAWRHGRLSPEDAARLQARLATDPEAQATLAEWDRQDAALSALQAPVAEPVPAKMRALLAEARAAKATRSPGHPRSAAALPALPPHLPCWRLALRGAGARPR